MPPIHWPFKGIFLWFAGPHRIAAACKDKSIQYMSTEIAWFVIRRCELVYHPFATFRVNEKYLTTANVTEKDTFSLGLTVPLEMQNNNKKHGIQLLLFLNITVFPVLLHTIRTTLYLRDL